MVSLSNHVAIPSPTQPPKILSILSIDVKRQSPSPIKGEGPGVRSVPSTDTNPLAPS